LSVFDRGLGALGFPALIRNPCLHTGVQIGEQRQRIGPIAAYEGASPCAEPIGRIGVVALKHPAEVDAIVRRIDERIVRCIRSDLELRPLHRIGFQLQLAFDLQFGGRFRERCDRDRITEHVVDPAY
jgi:hypothetical protein